MNVNEKQVGGNHYKVGYQHWDLVADLRLGYFEGQVTKYITRWRKKNGIQDLEKAQHFLDKLIHLVSHAGWGPSTSAFGGWSGTRANGSFAALGAILTQYSRENHLSPNEASIINTVACWNNLGQLQAAACALEGMIESARTFRVLTQNPLDRTDTDGSAPGPGYTNQG